MTINSIKDLDKLMLLCRKRGVLTIKIDNIEFRLDDTPTPTKPVKGAYTESPEPIETPDDLSPEDLLFYSATGQIENKA